MYVTRGMEGVHPKGGEGHHASFVRSHLHYLFSCFCHMVSCFLVEIYIYVILFNTYVRLCWNNPAAETVTLNGYICLQGRGGLKNRS